MFWKGAFKLGDLDDLTGRVILITGGTAGLGLSSAIGLASKNATVIISARTEEKGQKAVEEIRRQAKNANANVSYGIMEQADLKSVKKFAEWFLALDVPLHVLLLNAGVAVIAPKLVEGIESQFLINHVSHFYLVQLLLSKIKQSAPSRIVFVSSDGHRFVSKMPDWKQVAGNQYEDNASASFTQYCLTKLANIQTAVELSRRLAGEKVWVNAIHPGAVATDIGKKSPFASTFIGKGILMLVNAVFTSPQNGALTQIYASAHPDIEANDYRGQYFVPTAKKVEATAIAMNQESQKALWDLTENLLKMMN